LASGEAEDRGQIAGIVDAEIVGSGMDVMDRKSAAHVGLDGWKAVAESIKVLKRIDLGGSCDAGRYQSHLSQSRRTLRIRAKNVACDGPDILYGPRLSRRRYGESQIQAKGYGQRRTHRLVSWGNHPLDDD
jgi:hypothetical protein